MPTLIRFDRHTATDDLDAKGVPPDMAGIEYATLEFDVDGKVEAVRVWHAAILTDAEVEAAAREMLVSYATSG